MRIWCLVADVPSSHIPRIPFFPSSFSQACPAGKYSSTETATAASDCTACPAGTYSTAAAATSEGTCVQCDAGKYSAGSAESSSAAWFGSRMLPRCFALLNVLSRVLFLLAYCRCSISNSWNSLFAPPARRLSAHCKWKRVCRDPRDTLSGC